jgi:hypothetical protein
MSFSNKARSRLLSVVSMALIAQIGAAAATARPMDDRADELRALLSGRPAAAAATASAPRNRETTRSIGDAQQQARDVVLAIPTRTISAPPSYAAKPGRDRTRSDAQAQAQEVILGRVGASKTGA